MLESVIQRAIIISLRNNGWLVVKHIQTNLNGWPDLQCLKDGKCVFIEVKSKSGVLSDLQKHRHNQIKKAGFTVVIASTVDDISKF